MDKHLGVFITLMNSHLHVSLNYALRVNTHHVTPPHTWAMGVCGYYVDRVCNGWGFTVPEEFLWFIDMEACDIFGIKR